MGKLLSTALEYNRSKLNVIPVERGGKKPLGPWKQHAQKPQTPDEVAVLFPDDDRNIAILGGACSDNFIGVDFDSRIILRDRIEHDSHFAEVIAKTTTVNTARGRHVFLCSPLPV